ncbi:MAG: hypothetical protein ACK4R7_05020 [Fervidobacterium sp.]
MIKNLLSLFRLVLNNIRLFTLVFSLVFALIILVNVSTLAYVNVGVGYTFDTLASSTNGWILRIGFEENGFSLNADYLVNTSWNIDGSYLFETQLVFAVGPMVNIKNNFSNSSLEFKLGPSILLKLSNLELKIGYLMDFTQTNQFQDIAKNIHFQTRFYVPPPANMKMRDKLYVELTYKTYMVCLLVGLLEPF